MAYRVLIVDDEPSIRLAVSRYFTTIGFTTEMVATLSAAKTAVDERPFDVIITDLRLGAGLDDGGLVLASYCTTARPGAKLVILTAYASPETDSRARALGAVVVGKPKPLPDLAQVVMGLLA
ncbi:MAG: response regulator [Gemmatimonadales bacterium]